MRSTHIHRYNARRTHYAQWGCGCLLIGGFAALVGFLVVYTILPNLTGAAVQLAGANRLGETSSVFQNISIPPTAVVQNPTSQQQITVDLGQYGGGTINLDQVASDFVTGSSDSGQPIARASFTEADLMAICVQRSPVCQGGNNQYRNPALDLRPGGAVIYADVNVGGLTWQRIGVVTRLDNSRTYLQVAGIDINGGLYDYTTLPPEISARVDEIATLGNDVLRQMAVQAGGTNYSLSEIIIDDTTLTVILQ